MKPFLITILLLISNIITAQKTCESAEETFEDLNSITKCSIEDSKKKGSKGTRQISVKISAPKKRYLKKRKAAIASTSNANNLSTSNISETNHSSEITNAILQKEDTAIKNIAALSNTLSAEDVKKAIKFDDASVIPLFSNCKKSKNINCFNKEMAKHIEAHFKYPNDAVVKKLQGKVWIRFIIDKDGNVTNIKTLGPKGAKILDHEATRVVSKLPKFIPAKKNGRKISVKYGFPITFSLEE